ncbi:MAG TPA: indolepyruvate ferredoxin oxidoreductase family protein [Acidimicrobiales bacterium]
MSPSLSGIDALVQLLALRRQLDERAGLRTATMVSGYPGSPLGTLDLALDSAPDLLDAHEVLHRPGLNEELAAAVVWGSQMGSIVDYDGIDGVAGVWYGKAPGLDRSGDSLKHGNAMGSGPNGGVVVLCGDDPSAKSSTLASDSQYTFEDACIPVLFPGDQQELVDLGVHAFHLSRFSGAWVGLKVVTSVADGVGSVDLDPARHVVRDPGAVMVDGLPWRHVPLTTIGPHAVPEQETLVVHHRLAAVREYAKVNGLNPIIGAGDRLGIVCAGTTYVAVTDALADLGVTPDEAGIRILKLGMTYPLVEDTVIEFARSVGEVLVVEEKRPFVETQLRAILHEAGVAVRVAGKRDRDGAALVPLVGAVDAATIATTIGRLLPDLDRPAPAVRSTLPLLPLPGRAPAFCSGCPHNRSTVAPAGALVGGGVGCHGILYFEARQRETRRLPPTPMGAEGVPWIGLSPFVAEPHLLQHLGDGTLSHSGTLAIRACVAAGADITFKILYNSAVAMTGGQAVTGLMDVPALTRALEAEGVGRIVVCAEDPTRYGRRARWARGVRVLGRDHLEEVQEELQSEPGVSVIVYDQRCAAEARRLRKRGLLREPPRRVVINEVVCEGCGDCSEKSNCLSVLPVESEFGVKRQIHDPSCNRDYTCLEGDCPSFVTVTPAARGRRRATGSTRLRPSPPAGQLVAPTPARFERRFGIYFTGIGGTGVVTASRILAAAAEAAGLVVGGVDQTGLSQKAGAVVSHLHVARAHDDLGAATVGSGGADLYLSGDILQAAAETSLERVHPGRTLAVVEAAITPTSAMLQSAVAVPAATDLQRVIIDRVGADRTIVVDSKRIAEAVFADPLLANVVLLGAAFQRGGLPFTLADVEQALADGRAAADNRAAFEWGRWAVQDPTAVEACLDAAGAVGSIADPSAEALATADRLLRAAPDPLVLHDLLRRRTAQVVDYQDARRARRYLGLVADVAARDDEARDWALTRAVAESWFKLLTYKDEYEVARLHLRVDYDRVASDLGIDGPYRVAYHLHPPVLRRMGMTRKLALGKPYEAAFRVLTRMKRLRGTPLDPFGYDRDRRLERALVDEYEQLVMEASTAPYATQVALATSALDIKGYGPVKEAAVGRWHQAVTELRAASTGVAG